MSEISLFKHVINSDKSVRCFVFFIQNLPNLVCIVCLQHFSVLASQVSGIQEHPRPVATILDGAALGVGLGRGLEGSP